MRFANTAPAAPPAICAAIDTAASPLAMAPKMRSTKVTTGLNAAETGPRAKINATRTAPVINAFANSCNPTSPR